jgi:drug/metabolite transporter (DMT)-like permease
MDSDKQTAIIVGVLFIIATVMLFVGGVVYNPILGSPDYLDTAYPNRTIVVIGILLEFTIVPAILLIPVFLFPILKKHNEQLALGYVGFRFLEAVLIIIDESLKLSLINVSQNYLNSGGMAASYFQNIGSAIQAVSNWVFSLYVLVFALGALILYFVLYKSNLIPRIISAWGIIAAALMLIGTVLIMVGTFAGISEVALNLIFAMPIAAQEMVLAAWLILKGFNSSAIKS